MSHSPEPWGYEISSPPKDDPDGYCEIFARADATPGMRNTLVVTWVCEDGDASYGIRQVDAARIVACVNACKGIATETLEAVVRGETLILRKRDELYPLAQPYYEKRASEGP